MDNDERAFHLTCWSCGRANIPFVFQITEGAPPATTTVQVPCPFCQKMMTVDIPFELALDATAIKRLPTKQA